MTKPPDVGAAAGTPPPPINSTRRRRRLKLIGGGGVSNLSAAYRRRRPRLCARTRPLEHQKLSDEIFEREHTKPLFSKHLLLTVHNLYSYHCCNELFKVLKHHTPISLFELFTLSKRPGKETLLLYTLPSNSFVYQASSLWNAFRQLISLSDFNVTQGAFKSRLKNTILLLQKKGDVENWEPTVNFSNSI